MALLFVKMILIKSRCGRRCLFEVLMGKYYAANAHLYHLWFNNVLVCNDIYASLFSSRGCTQKSTTVDFPLRKAKLPSYPRKPPDSNLLSCSLTSRNRSSPFRGAGVLGHDLPPLTHLRLRL